MTRASLNRDLALLHPAMRERVERLMADIQSAELPLRLFEGWRSPERQQELYAQGRTRPGNIVTYARPWESYHQYGLAVDIVGFVNGGWTWDLPKGLWSEMHKLGAGHGLERLGFETPHLQMADLKIKELMAGNLPDGGDDNWGANMEAAISNWNGSPSAPPFRRGREDRPAFRELAHGAQFNWSATPKMGASDWHSRFDGRLWRHDGRGVYLHWAPTQPVRSAGAPVTCQAILDLYGQDIHEASIKHGVPPELIVMTIATETGFARKDKFTGARTFRWEAHVKVTDVDPPTQGDYSAGPMQTLATTARHVIRSRKLNYPDPFAIAPNYRSEPSPVPATHPLYEGGPNIDIGTAEIFNRWSKTGDDPILVAAAYNAGGLYESSANEWRLRSSNDHLDRAAKWFGDACFILSALR